jgi:hypothetical protein
MAKAKAGSGELPRELVRGREQLDAWRRSGSRGTAMPPKLWELAVKLGRRHGNFRTARALGLDSGKLKRMGGGGPSGVSRPRRPSRSKRAAARFVEVSAMVAPAIDAGCRMTLRGPQGEQLQMDLAPNAAALLVAQLCRSGWTAARP